MLHKAVVIDNSMVFTRGKIRVRIAGMYHRKLEWNLEERFPDLIEEEETEGSNTQFSTDYEALISSAFGGGRNYGSFVIPQINEKGIVSFLGGSKNNPVWLGGLFEASRDDNFDVEFVNFPSDKFEDGEDTDGVIDGEGNIGDDVEPQEEKSFIIRTKHTTSESQEEIDFQQQKTSNIITAGKKRIRVTHFPEDGWKDGVPKKYKDFLIGLTGEEEDVIRLTSRDEENENYVDFELKEEQGVISLTKEGTEIAQFSINEKEITLFNKEGENKLVFNDDGVEISNKEGANKIIFNDKNEIEIANDSGSKIVMKKNGNIELIPDNEIHILGASDNLVRYSDLKTIIEEFETHIHVSPVGPTSPALTSSNAPINSMTTKPSIDMKSMKGKVD